MKKLLISMQFMILLLLFGRSNIFASEIKTQVFFYKSEAEIPQSNFDADIIYGFAPSIVKTSRSLKWLCVPWAGVDSLMTPDYFANEDCLLTNSAGA